MAGIKNLEEFRVYLMAIEIGENVWNIVTKWDTFAKDTIGNQFVRSIDSVAANLSEGFGRFHFRESNHFNYYSRGSLYESKTWLTKAHNRKLVNDEDFERMIIFLEEIGVKLNNYINTIGKGK